MVLVPFLLSIRKGGHRPSLRDEFVLICPQARGILSYPCWTLFMKFFKGDPELTLPSLMSGCAVDSMLGWTLSARFPSMMGPTAERSSGISSDACRLSVGWFSESGLEFLLVIKVHFHTHCALWARVGKPSDRLIGRKKSRYMFCEVIRLPEQVLSWINSWCCPTTLPETFCFLPKIIRKSHRSHQ